MCTQMNYSNAGFWNHDCFETIKECIKDAKENYHIDLDVFILVNAKTQQLVVST